MFLFLRNVTGKSIKTAQQTTQTHGSINAFELLLLVFISESIFLSCAKDGTENNIGHADTEIILNFLKSLPKSLVADLPNGIDVDNATKNIRPLLNPSIKGVVIIGGYDIVPPCPR